MIKIMLIALSLGVIVTVILTIIMAINSTPLTKAQVIAYTQTIVNNSIGKSNVTNAIVLIDSSHYDISTTFTAGHIDGLAISNDQPFHVASIGKAFTSTLIAILIEDGQLKLEDQISTYLSDELLSDLYVYDGMDYSHKVTIGQLLNHTSGVADYFADKTHGSDSMVQLILKDKEKLWLPTDLLDFTRDYQQCIAMPGQIYHYSDTGYVLLGLVIERVSGQAFGDLLHQKIFTPLNMKDSYLMFNTEPVNPPKDIADVWLDATNIKDYTSLSIDWSGGGIISTAKDLSLFIRALNNGDLINKTTLTLLYQFDWKFMRGIHYGHGFMEYHFGEFFPTMNTMPNYIGHMGVLGTQMFYDQDSDTVYISSFGSSDYSAGSVRTMIKLVSLLMRIKED